MSTAKQLEYVRMKLKIAEANAAMSPDPFMEVGCVITSERGKILSEGYNTIRTDRDIPFQYNRDKRRAYVSHAEIEALRKIKHRHYKTIVVYATHFPCYSCLHALRMYKIHRLYYIQMHPSGKDDECLEVADFFQIPYMKVTPRTKPTK